MVLQTAQLIAVIYATTCHEYLAYEYSDRYDNVNKTIYLTVSHHIKPNITNCSFCVKNYMKSITKIKKHVRIPLASISVTSMT